MLLFGVIAIPVIYFFIALFSGGDISSIEAITNSVQDFNDKSPMFFKYLSFVLPIIVQVGIIIWGIFLIKPNLKSLFTLNGFKITTLLKIAVVGVGVQTVMSILAQLISFVLEVFGLGMATVELTMTDDPISYSIFMYFYACILGPVIEEVLYRGVLLQGLRKYNEKLAIIITSLIFGLMHLNYQQFIFASVLGIVLSAVTLKCNSIYPAIFAHIFVNTTGVLSQLLMQSVDYEGFNSLINDPFGVETISPELTLVAILIFFIRLAAVVGTAIILIQAMIKKGNFRKTIPAGKKRGFPILASSWIWYVIFIGYAYLTFIEPLEYIG